jgi:hypothetical protein
MSATHPASLTGADWLEHLDEEHGWADVDYQVISQGNTDDIPRVKYDPSLIDLSEQVHALSKAFNGHVQRCERCFPLVGELCEEGVTLEDAFHTLAALRLQFEFASRR